MNVKDIRVVQKLRRRSSLKEVDGQLVVDNWIEKTRYLIQIKRDGFATEWEDLPVIEEYEDD